MESADCTLLHDLKNLLLGADEEKKLALFKKYEIYFYEISQKLYRYLDDDDKKRFLVWFAKRWGNIDLVDKVELDSYLKIIDMVKTQQCEKVLINGHAYKLQDMDIQGYGFKLAAYDWVLGVHDIYYNQYEHKNFKIHKGDIIIDAGGFIGDTAALFCEKTSKDCEIHSFELLDENINLFKFNNLLNGIEDHVIVNQLALSDKTGEKIYIKQAGVQGATSMFGNCDTDKELVTTTLDDYVKSKGLKKVDMIKMDIEGAEIPALMGAIDTIKTFQPRLALCLYHKWNDVVTIPRFLDQLGLDYKYYFKWVQLTHGWEAVLLAEI